MVFNWQIVGIEVVRLIVFTVVGVVSGALLFRKYVAPELTAALENATDITQKIASLGGIKKKDYEVTKELSKLVTADLVKSQFPELEMVKLVVAPGTWEQIENALETNPAGVMELVEKYGHYFTKGATEETSDFDF